jgi:hypothetical protein
VPVVSRPEPASSCRDRRRLNPRRHGADTSPEARIERNSELKPWSQRLSLPTKIAYAGGLAALIAGAFVFGLSFGDQARTTTYALSSGSRLAAAAPGAAAANETALAGATTDNGLGSATMHPATDPFLPQFGPALLYFSPRSSTTTSRAPGGASTPFAFAATKPGLPLLRTTTTDTTRSTGTNDAPPSSSAPTGSSASPAPPAPPVRNTTPITISDVRTVALTPFSATIEWRTSEPVSAQVAYGSDAPTVWTPADGDSTSHVATVNGLVDGTSYRLRIDAKADDGRTASSPLVVTTPSLPVQHANPTLTVHNDSFQLDNRPTIPTIVWAACADQIPSLLAAGIDTFMGKNCGDGSREVAALGGHGFFIGDAFQPATPGAAGSFLPDEWDTNLPNDLTSADVQREIPDNVSGTRFLTLTNHFFSNAAPLPQGRGMYPALIANADVIGFDLYPLENWCRYDDFGKVFDSQRELTQLAAGKPTYQWIETARMDCPDPSLEPTPQTVHAETWLALAGGAHAIGYFPKDFSPAIGDQIVHDKRDMEALAPALVEPPIDATGSGNVRVGARQHNGAIYVVAVNASREPSTSAISVPALGNRSLSALDGSHSVTAVNGTFTDTFDPLEVRIYVAAP